MSPRAANAVEAVTRVYGADPYTTARIGALDVAYGLSLSGRSGWLRGGLAAGVSDTPTRWAGYAHSPQSFKGAAPFIGTTPAGVRPGFNTALPNTAGPFVAGSTPNRILDILRATS